MALREDEDVAKAMGINHVATKLLAFASGAFFAGLGGTLFAAKLSSTYPQSFQFLVSINVLSLIIIGGMGSIPGVLVGGFALVGPAGAPARIRRVPLPGLRRGAGGDDADEAGGPRYRRRAANSSCTRRKTKASRRQNPRRRRQNPGAGVNAMAVLEAKKVTKRFGGLQALSNIDLEVKEQSIHSVIGPNGAGKTTFFNCVTGFYIPEEGEILLKGRNITGLSPDRVTQAWGLPHLPEHPPVQEHDGRGEHPGRHAPPPQVGADRRHPARPAHDEGRGRCRR